MKKQIYFTLIIVYLILVCPVRIYASEYKAPVVVEKKDIPALSYNPEEDKPTEKLVPIPTPTPYVDPKIKLYTDIRSWTKYIHKELIAQAAKTYDLDPQVIYATIMTESEGNPYAFRYEPKIKDASLGLGQILISTAKLLGFKGHPKELYKPEVAIDLIGKYHRLMLDKYGTLSPTQLATAYNTGSPFKRPVKNHLFRFDKWYNEEST